jgi:hypothetical protein
MLPIGHQRGIKHHDKRGKMVNKKFQKINPGTFASVGDVIIAMVIPRGIEPLLPG